MHLFLVGPPGIGKSTVAPLLAEALGGRAIDLDGEIERVGGKPCAAIISEDGMPRFRALESEALAALRPTPAVIVASTGGGAVLLEQNRARMGELGLRIGLSGSVATVALGLAATMGKRAHLDESPRGHAARVLKERRDAYADVDASFRVDGAEPHEVALAIAAWLVSARGLRIDVNASRSSPTPSPPRDMGPRSGGRAPPRGSTRRSSGCRGGSARRPSPRSRRSGTRSALRGSGAMAA